MGLPIELRLMIYRHLLVVPSGRPIPTGALTSRRYLHLNILETCHQVRAEAFCILKYENVFMHVMHNSEIFEDMLNFHGIFSVAKPSHARGFPRRSLKIMIIFQLSELWPIRHMVIGSDDPPKMCGVLWIFSATVARIGTILIQPDPRNIARMIPRKSPEDLVVPLRRLWQAARFWLIRGGRFNRIRGPGSPPALMTSVPSQDLLANVKAFRIDADMLREAKDYWNSAVCYSKLAYMVFELNKRPAFKYSNPFYGGTGGSSSLWCRLAAEGFRFSSGFSRTLAELGERDRAISIAAKAYQVIAMKKDCPGIPISSEEILDFRNWAVGLVDNDGEVQPSGVTIEEVE